MEIDFRKDSNVQLDRIYVAALYLNNFRGQKNVEVQLFRPGASEAELVKLRGKGLVGRPQAGMPPELIAGATEDMALACLLETFTLPEAEQLAAYIGNRYKTHASRLVVCPLDLPLPLGVGPLASLPETESAGFLNFDLAPDFPLDFKLRGYFELSQTG